MKERPLEPKALTKEQERANELLCRCRELREELICLAGQMEQLSQEESDILDWLEERGYTA